jgi:hypothetical protein
MISLSPPLLFMPARAAAAAISRCHTFMSFIISAFAAFSADAIFHEQASPPVAVFTPPLFTHAVFHFIDFLHFLHYISFTLRHFFILISFSRLFSLIDIDIFAIAFSSLCLLRH